MFSFEIKMFLSQKVDLFKALELKGQRHKQSQTVIITIIQRKLLSTDWSRWVYQGFLSSNRKKITRKNFRSTQCISAWISPSIILLIGAKKCMLIGSIMNTIYCAMFLKPNAVVKGIKPNLIRHKYNVYEWQQEIIKMIHMVLI